LADYSKRLAVAVAQPCMYTFPVVSANCIVALALHASGPSVKSMVCSIVCVPILNAGPVVGVGVSKLMKAMLFAVKVRWPSYCQNPCPAPRCPCPNAGLVVSSAMVPPLAKVRIEGKALGDKGFPVLQFVRVTATCQVPSSSKSCRGDHAPALHPAESVSTTVHAIARMTFQFPSFINLPPRGPDVLPPPYRTRCAILFPSPRKVFRIALNCSENF